MGQLIIKTIGQILFVSISIVGTMLLAIAQVRVDREKKIAPPNIRFMRVTAYCPCDKCCGKFADGITASGHKIQPGDRFCAAAKDIPFGTFVRIATYNGERPVQVLDRGSAIGPNELDVFFDSHQAALDWGVRICEVEFLE